MEDPILQVVLPPSLLQPREEDISHTLWSEGESHGNGDMQTIRDVLSIRHVPVVASLQWDKLQSILHSLCDGFAAQSSRLEKAEEQGKCFLVLKDELDQLCKNAVKEMKEAQESEFEQQQNWSKMVDDRLQMLQQGMEANNSSINKLNGSVETISPRLDFLEAATRNLEALNASHPISLESLGLKLDELLVDFDEQNEKLHMLEEQNEQMKLRLEQTIKSHSHDLEVLQQYCRNLRSDFELKFLVNVGKMSAAVDNELSASSQSKLEAAVAQLQNHVRKKADADEIKKISQNTQNVKDAFEKMELTVVELQSQLRRLSVGSKRLSRLSSGLLSQDNQILLSESNVTSVDQLSPKVVEELTKDVKASIESHHKQLTQVHKDICLVGKSVLILSGHDNGCDPAKKNLNIPERAGNLLLDALPATHQNSSRSALDGSFEISSNIMTDNRALSIAEVSSEGLTSTKIFEAHLTPRNSQRLSSAMDQLDDECILAIDEALKMGKFEAKLNFKDATKMFRDIEHISSMIHDLDTSIPILKDGLALKADKLDTQRLACYVKEQLESPENVLFTARPLYGYKCMSCDHTVEKLSPIAGDHVLTNRMPPQILPMLSAERIFGFDRRYLNSPNSMQGRRYPNIPSGVPYSSRGFPSRRTSTPFQRPPSPRRPPSF